MTAAAQAPDPWACFKQEAAEHAVTFVESGMTVGLGSGSTALFAVRRLADLLRAGQVQDVLGCATSERVRHEALRLGIPLLGESLPQAIDLTIDGADEVDPELNLIKGGGGALLREKIVAEASRRVLIVVDETKLSPALGKSRAVPVEVLPFGWQAQVRYLESLGARTAVRQTDAGDPFRTDQGNLLLDCCFGPIADAPALARRMEARAGLLGHGLFLGLASMVIVAGPAGLRRIERFPESKA
jgi:ribose 5-phosphate isomerase A